MSIWDWDEDFERRGSAEWVVRVEARHRISLGEGNTPLIRSRCLGPSYGLNNLFFKLESVGPTGSYKDRFAAAAISWMRASGKSHCLATSSGNTGAALAAYCAAAQIRCTIAVVESAPLEKLQQMLLYGARLIQVRGFGTNPDVTAQVFEAIFQASRAEHASLQISAFWYSPEGMSGVQTISYELAAAGADHVFAPAGGGGLALAVTRGFQNLVAAGTVAKSPAIQVVQPDGNDTIATPLALGHDQARAVNCTTRISGLQVASVIDGDELLRAARASGGTGLTVQDEEVWQVQAELALREGIFCEPAAAVSVAGALRALKCSQIEPDSIVVCLITGAGFKDQSAVARMVAPYHVPLVDLSQFPAELERHV